jgi:hypothetical protein
VGKQLCGSSRRWGHGNNGRHEWWTSSDQLHFIRDLDSLGLVVFDEHLILNLRMDGHATSSINLDRQDLKVEFTLAVVQDVIREAL